MIKIMKDCIRIFLITLREMFIFVASLFLLFFYIIFIRTGEYFLVDAVICIPLIAMVISNIFVMLKYKKHIRKASIIGAVIGLIIIIGANEMVCMQYTNFSSEKWKKSQTIRHFMIDDLTKNYLKENMSATEVENLLGEYSFTRYKNEGDLEQTISYYYSYYGYHERLSNDLYLNIYFNSENKIVRWEFYEEPALWN
ncbi:hypothetical protein [Oceanirhabdus seepicola]|uniref:Uncharacterized protein n=1 Tax=Oceanirhabdus seepicola TaxID=2828781 RepID=A0A9J6P144_9CLOT|nr:hypothetical protein [Oceanirhabdus seepicola]MCM1989168.1 hypothetical protein [Oceanirhabdus seepicola]